MFFKITAHIAAILCCILAIAISVKTDSITLRLIMIAVSGVSGYLAARISPAQTRDKKNS
jgi:hypothetical protein